MYSNSFHEPHFHIPFLCIVTTVRELSQPDLQKVTTFAQHSYLPSVEFFTEVTELYFYNVFELLSHFMLTVIVRN